MNELKIEYLPVSALKPYERNPRKIEKAVDYVKNSIEAFGFRVPIVIDKDRVIVAGHTRYMAAKRIGMDMVPCIVADQLTDDQVKAYRLIDNKTQELSTWDFSKLISELDEIADQYQLELIGFNEQSKKTSGGNGDGEQILDDGEELDLGDFEDEQFTCTCPSCGFRFND